jgi:hypothetical protein
VSAAYRLAAHVLAAHLAALTSAAPPPPAAAPAAPPALALALGLGLATGRLRILRLWLHVGVIEMLLRRSTFIRAAIRNVARLARQ